MSYSSPILLSIWPSTLFLNERFYPLTLKKNNVAKRFQSYLYAWNTSWSLLQDKFQIYLDDFPSIFWAFKSTLDSITSITVAFDTFEGSKQSKEDLCFKMILIENAVWEDNFPSFFLLCIICAFRDLLICGKLQ